MADEQLEAVALAGVLDRPRLYGVLDAPMVRVCVVQGPSGSGKTTLLRSWALQQTHPLTWVTLGDGGISRQAFWRHVVGSARRLGELSADAAARVIEQLTLTADPVRVAIDLLADAGPVTLVFDAYEHLGDVTREIDADLARLVAALPDLRLLITTRGRTALADLDPPGGVVRMMTLGELAMTADEVAALMVRQAGVDDERLAQSVTQATRGFPLTVRAVVLALSQLGRIPRVHSLEWDAVVAARWESLLPDEVAVRFVSDTSVPPYVDVALATELTKHPAAEQLLNDLERHGFGRWIPYAHEHPVFQYAETIRDTFRTRSRTDAERFRLACVRTAQWLFGNDEIDQALIFAIEGRDYAFADRAFVALVIGNPDTYITDRFLPTLRQVPEEVLAQYPMLAFGLGLALAANPLLRLEAPHAFRIAIDSPAQPAYLEPAIDRFSLAAMRAVSLRTAYSFRDSAEAALDVVRSVDALPAGSLAQFGEHIGTILRQLSYSLLQGGLVDEAIGTAVRSVSLCRSQAARNYSIVYAAGATAFAGDIVRSRNFSSRIDMGAWPLHLQRSYLNGMGTIAAAFERLDALDFGGCLDVLRETDSYTPTGEFWPLFTAVSVSARHGLGQALAEAERVERELAGPTPPGTGDNAATDHLHGVLARAWIAGGNSRAARRLLDGLPPDRAHLAGPRISRLLADERSGDALALAEEALRLPGHTLRTGADVRTTGAVAALREGEHARAWAWLNDATVTWETSGPRLHVAMLHARDRRLLCELAEEEGSASVLRYLDVPFVEGQAGVTPVVSLTPREVVVLRALAGPGSLRELAEGLVVSRHTIKTQVTGLYRKLGVSSRRSAVVVGRDLGFLDDDSASKRSEAKRERLTPGFDPASTGNTTLVPEPPRAGIG